MNTENKTKKPVRLSKRVRVQNELANTPEHIRNLVYLLISNAEIRRYTSRGIINLMKQKDYIPADAKCYIEFKNTKYLVWVNGLETAFTYNNTIFMNCFAASFISFANAANKVINTFLKVENASINDKEITEIVNDLDNSPVEEEPTQA